VPRTYDAEHRRRVVELIRAGSLPDDVTVTATQALYLVTGLPRAGGFPVWPPDGSRPLSFASGRARLGIGRQLGGRAHAPPQGAWVR
jgi:hypothetical protein